MSFNPVRKNIGRVGTLQEKGAQLRLPTTKECKSGVVRSTGEGTAQLPPQTNKKKSGAARGTGEGTDDSSKENAEGKRSNYPQPIHVEKHGPDPATDHQARMQGRRGQKHELVRPKT